MRHIMRIFLLCTFLAAIAPDSDSFARTGPAETVIIIDLEQQKKANPLVFGHNALGHDACVFSENRACSNNGKYSNRGAGQWRPAAGIPDPSLARLARRINMSFLRFPGGCGTHLYNWKKGIGPPKKRPMFRFGLDEFLRLCEELDIEPIITISYFTGSDQDIADLIEYLNHPLGSGNPNGGPDWARIRADNGHPRPYGVRYFELGNEVYHGDHVTSGPPAPRQYAERYLRCRRLMKEIDQEVRLGAVMQGWTPGVTHWDDEVATVLAGELDFAIIHVYPISYRSNSDLYPTRKIFRAALAAPAQVEDNLKKISTRLARTAGRPIPLAITEYNGHFTQDFPVPYRHSLGNALLIADLLRVFLTMDVPVLGANYWQFANSYWGLLYNDSFQHDRGQYTRRPNFLVFELFAPFADTSLLRTSVHGPTYRSEALGGVLATGAADSTDNPGPGTTPGTVVIRPEDWRTRTLRQLLSLSIPVRTDVRKNALRLSFRAGNNTDYYHTSCTVPVHSGSRYRLSAKIRTENLTQGAGIYLAVQDSRGWQETGWQTTTERISGTHDWQDVDVEFQPLGDSRKITILIRRDRGGRNAGRAWIKDVTLARTGPAHRFPRETPWLSALAGIDHHQDTIMLLVINKNPDQAMAGRIILPSGFPLDTTILSRRLTGPSLSSTNENRQEHVTLHETEEMITPVNNVFTYLFRPGSITVLELRRKLKDSASPPMPVTP